MLKKLQGSIFPHKKALYGQDAGFSLVEILVSLTMISLLVGALASLTTLAGQTQIKLLKNRAANNILQQEVAIFESSLWDDVMMAPAAGGPALCPLGQELLPDGELGPGNRSSAQIVKPEDMFNSEGVPIKITREVTWYSSGNVVSCNAIPNDRDEMKQLTITATWDFDTGEPRSRSATLYLSKNRDTSKVKATTVFAGAGAGPAALAAGTYSELVTQKEPLGWWRLDELSGTTAVNKVSNGVNGVYTNTPLQNAGRMADDGNSVAFNGTTHRITMARQASINDANTTQFTVEAWIMPTNVNTSTPQVIYEEGGTGNGINLYIQSGRLYGTMWTDNTIRSLISTPIQNNTMYHIAYVYTNSGPRTELYMNSLSMGFPTTNTVATLGLHTDPNGIGSNNAGTRTHNNTTSTTGTWSFQGRIGDVARYNYPLTARQINEHAEKGGTKATASNISSPSAPRNLTTVEIMTAKVGLSWEAPENTGGGIIESYIIERNDEAFFTTATGWTGPSQEWKTIGNTVNRSYVDEGLQKNKLYLYRISAVNAAGKGLFSESAPGKGGWPAGRPTGLSQPEYYPSTGTVLINFGPPQEDNEVAVDYAAWYSTQATGGINPNNPPPGTEATITCNSDGTSCTARWNNFADKLGTKYYFYIYSNNGLGYSTPLILTPDPSDGTDLLEPYAAGTVQFCAAGETELADGSCQYTTNYTYNSPRWYQVFVATGGVECICCAGTWWGGCTCGTKHGDCCLRCEAPGYWEWRVAYDAKDPTPAGCTDNGSRWVCTKGKTTFTVYGLKTKGDFNDQLARNFGFGVLYIDNKLAPEGESGQISRCRTTAVPYQLRGINGTFNFNYNNMPCN